MKPLLDIGYVLVGIETGLLVALAPFIDRMVFHEAVSHAFTPYALVLGIIFFIIASMIVMKRRQTIPCGCAGEMTHIHNPWIQIPVAALIAVAFYGIVSWLISYF